MSYLVSAISLSLLRQATLFANCKHQIAAHFRVKRRAMLRVPLVELEKQTTEVATGLLEERRGEATAPRDFW